MSDYIVLAIADYYDADYYDRRDAYYQQGKYELALKDYKQALKIGALPNNQRGYIEQKIQELK